MMTVASTFHSLRISFSFAAILDQQQDFLLPGYTYNTASPKSQEVAKSRHLLL
jgi:hypothetical protein